MLTVAVLAPTSWAAVPSTSRIGARCALLGLVAISSSAIRARPLRRVHECLHMVVFRHHLKLTTCRLAGFADIDGLRQRQVAQLQQLMASALVTDADYDPVANHRLFYSAEVARSCQSADVAEKGFESFAALLRSTVEDVALVRDVHGADAEVFERGDDRIQPLTVVRVLKLHRAVHVIGVVAYAGQKNGCALFLTLVREIRRNFVVLVLLAKTSPIVGHVTASDTQRIRNAIINCSHIRRFTRKLLTPCIVLVYRDGNYNDDNSMTV